MLTLANLGCGGAAMLVLLAGLSEQPLRWALGLIGLGAIFDALDGPLARRLKVAGPAGARRDAIADGVSFGLLPALAVLLMCWSRAETDAKAMVAFAACFFVGAAIHRLRRHVRAEISTREKSVRGSVLRGLPVPAAGLILMVAIVLATEWRVTTEDSLVARDPSRYLSVLAMLLGVLMVSSFAPMLKTHAKSTGLAGSRRDQSSSKPRSTSERN